MVHISGDVTLSVHVFLCDVFLVTHVGDLTHLRPLHAQMSQAEKH